MNRTFLLILAGLFPIISGCDKEKDAGETEYIECKVNGVKWKSRTSSIACDWADDHISISGYDNDESASLSILVMGNNLQSGTYPLSSTSFAKYADLDISSSEGHYTDSLHGGSITFVFDEANHKVSGTFSFDAKFQTNGDIIKVTEGRFSALEIKN